MASISSQPQWVNEAGLSVSMMMTENKIFFLIYPATSDMKSIPDVHSHQFLKMICVFVTWYINFDFVNYPTMAYDISSVYCNHFVMIQHSCLSIVCCQLCAVYHLIYEVTIQFAEYCYPWWNQWCTHRASVYMVLHWQGWWRGYGRTIIEILGMVSIHRCCFSKIWNLFGTKTNVWCV